MKVIFVVMKLAISVLNLIFELPVRVEYNARIIARFCSCAVAVNEFSSQNNVTKF